MSSCKVAVIFVRFQRNSNFLDTFSENTQISNIVKIRTVGAKMFHAGKRKKDGHTDRQTGRHDKVNSRFSQFCEQAKKTF
jgi:hypothetical protein